MGLTVGFDATAAARQRAGIGRYARELLRALLARQDGTAYRLVYGSGGNGELPPLPAGVRARALPVSDRVTNLLWHRLRLPLPVELAAGRFDLFHSPDFTAPPTLRKPTIVTVHDLAFIRAPECAYPTLRAYLQRVVPRAVAGASHVVVVSENTKRDLIEILNVPEEKTTVISPAVADLFRHPPEREEAARMVVAAGVAEPYILAVGTLEPRKNYVRLLEAFHLLRQRGRRERLVIVGARGWMYEPVFRRLRQLGLEEHVTFTTTDDVVLAALYVTAAVVVCASVYEGFGIPALEALAAGAPVVSSNAASLPEVVGEAAILFDPLDVNAMADAIERVLTDATLTADLRARGPGQAARYSWTESAARTEELYRRVAGRA